MPQPTLPRSIGPGAAIGLQGVSTAVRNPLDYAGRSGYLHDFVGGVELPMPVPRAGYGDVALVQCPDRPGVQAYDLRYHHFSVVTCMSRRMPLYSCVNLDGSQDRKPQNSPSWRKDPRIDLRYQLLTDGIYGNQHEGLFSRGHMTRREDPNWGSDEDAELSNEDTFHVTNACPQVQGFNAPIWLGLEDYIKSNAWADDMRISVMTGPVFAPDDPVYTPLGHSPIQVPVNFWKVVIFQHDATGELVATAYKASQAALLPECNRARPQFVFGAFHQFQMKISDLQEEVDLDFGPIVALDVLRDLSDGFTLQHAMLEDVFLQR